MYREKNNRVKRAHTVDRTGENGAKNYKPKADKLCGAEIMLKQAVSIK